MDKNRRTKYLVAIYLVVASLSIILALVGINYTQNPFQSLIINISTELFGVAILFFLVNRIFASNEAELSDRIESLIDHLERQQSFLRGVDSNQSLDTILSESNEICFSGYTLIRILKHYESILTKRVRSGAIVRLIMVDPESKSAQIILENSEIKDFPSDIQLSIDYARRINNDGRSNKRGRVEVRLISWIPSCSLILIDPKRSNGLVRVTIYPPFFRSPIAARPHFNLSQLTHRQWYATYVEQFEKLWQQGRAVEIS